MAAVITNQLHLYILLNFVGLQTFTWFIYLFLYNFKTKKLFFVFSLAFDKIYLHSFYENFREAQITGSDVILTFFKNS